MAGRNGKSSALDESGGVSINGPNTEAKSRNPNGKMTTDEMMRPNSSQNQLQAQARLMQKNSVGSELDAQEEDNNAKLYRSLVGLVKLQALVRGIRARKRVAKMLAA